MVRVSVCDEGGDDEWETIIIYRPYRRTPDGKLIWAKWFGKKAFPIPIRVRKKPRPDSNSPRSDDLK